jgi:hypothetical protein
MSPQQPGRRLLALVVQLHQPAAFSLQHRQGDFNLHGWLSCRSVFALLRGIERRAARRQHDATTDGQEHQGLESISRKKPWAEKAVVRTLALISSVNSSKTVALRAATFAALNGNKSGQKGFSSMAASKSSSCCSRLSHPAASAQLAEPTAGNRSASPAAAFRPRA